MVASGTVIGAIDGLVGASYSREDDEAFRRALSDLRDAFQRDLSAQLGRARRNFRLWQDQEAIAPGQMWESQIAEAVEEAVFFIPIVTPRAVASKYCKFEFESFLARERALGRNDLVFPIHYILVPALLDEAEWRNDPVLSVVGKRHAKRPWRASFRSHPASMPDRRRCIGDGSVGKRPGDPEADGGAPIEGGPHLAVRRVDATSAATRAWAMSLRRRAALWLSAMKARSAVRMSSLRLASQRSAWVSAKPNSSASFFSLSAVFSQARRAASRPLRACIVTSLRRGCGRKMSGRTARQSIRCPIVAISAFAAAALQFVAKPTSVIVTIRSWPFGSAAKT